MDWVRASSEIEGIGCPDALWEQSVRLFSEADFGALISLSSNAHRTNVTLRTNVPELYEGMPPEHDPFLEHCCSSYEVTRVGAGYLPNYDYLPEPAKEFIRRCAAIGFETGFGIPVRLEGATRFGGFILGSALSVEALERKRAPQIDAIRAFCLLLYRRFEELTSENSKALNDLSPRERDVIQLLIQGATRKEIARALDLSPNTVAEYTKTAYRKLGVRNKVEATRKLAS